MRVVRLLGAFFLILMISACQVDLSGLTASREEPTQEATATETIVPTLTPLPTRKPTATALPSPTFIPSPPPVQGAVLSPTNIAAAYMESIKLSLIGSGFYWPGGSQLLIRGETGLLSIALQPLSPGAMIKLENSGSVLDISPDASHILTQNGDGGVRIWNRLDGTSQSINFGAAYLGGFSPDGKTILLGSTDHFKVTLFDTESLKQLAVLSGFETAAPAYVALPGPANLQVVYFARGNAQLQDVQSGKIEKSLDYPDGIFDLKFSPDGNWLLVTSRDLLQAVSTHPAGETHAFDLTSLPETPISAVFSPDGSMVAAGVGNSVGIWDTATWSQITRLPQQSGQVRLVGFSPDGKILVSQDDQNELAVWRLP